MSDPGVAGDRAVYWLGGAPGAGKSSVTRLLAQRHGLWAYYADWHVGGHERERRLTLDEFPAFARWGQQSPEEHWVITPPSQMVEDVIEVWLERFPLVVRDVQSLPPGPCLVEGAGCLPEAVAEWLDDHELAAWLIPTPGVIREARVERYAAGNSSARGTSDPGRALENIIQRDILLTERIESEARALGMPVITIDRSRPISMVADELEARFGLPSLNLYVGAYQRGDGRTIRVDRSDASLRFVWSKTCTFSLRPQDVHVFSFAAGLFAGEIVKFVMDDQGNALEMTAASDRYRRIAGDGRGGLSI